MTEILVTEYVDKDKPSKWFIGINFNDGNEIEVPKEIALEILRLKARNTLKEIK